MTIHVPQLSRTEAIATARRMHDAGWAINTIRRYLADRGQNVSWVYVKCWVDDEYRERYRAKERRRQRQEYRRRHGVRPAALKVITPVEKFDRLRELREAGLSQSDTAKVLRLDFGDDVTEHMVRYAEQSGRYPLSARKAAA